MLQIGICDDDPSIRAMLRRYLDKFSASRGIELSVFCYDSGERFLESDYSGLDLLIMDIQMSGIDGLETARRIRVSNQRLMIIFFTNYIQYALEGYEVQAYRFLLKPLTYEDFSNVAGKALTELKSRQEAVLTIRTKARTSRIPVGSILYVETCRGHILVHTRTETVESYSSMKEAEDALSRHMFVRCHSAFLVSLREIKSITQQDILLYSGVSIPLSKHRRKAVSLKEENERARQQLHVQYRHFLMEQENNSRIKALHHDMQNHLRTLEAMSGAENVQSYIRELQQNIRDLEPFFSTGNPTLDALLSVKKSECDQAGIELTCLIHLTRPDFLTSMEICTLFGNCIDNAIEAVSDERVSRRYIHLSGGEVNGNMVIRIENPYAHTLRPRNDTFDTTKAEQGLHGYGLINIRRVVEQRSGTVTIKTENNQFVITWMIPLT